MNLHLQKLFDILENDFVIGAFSSIFLLLIACITYYQTKKIKFFESYFERKSNAFEALIASVQNIPRDEMAMNRIATSARIASLYCFADTYSSISEILAISQAVKGFKDGDFRIREHGKKFADVRSELTTKLRTELNLCRRFRFSDGMWMRLRALVREKINSNKKNQEHQ